MDPPLIAANSFSFEVRGASGTEFGSPKVTQSLGFGLRPSDSNPSLRIVSEFEFVLRMLALQIRIDYLEFESDGSDLKPKDWVTSLDLNSCIKTIS